MVLGDQLQHEEFVKHQQSWSVARLLMRGQEYKSGRLVALRCNSFAVNTQVALGSAKRENIEEGCAVREEDRSSSRGHYSSVGARNE